MLVKIDINKVVRNGRYAQYEKWLPAVGVSFDTVFEVKDPQRYNEPSFENRVGIKVYDEDKLRLDFLLRRDDLTKLETKTNLEEWM